MGDAGLVLFGPIGREILGSGTIIFAIFAAGSQIHAGQLALSVVSDNKLCAVTFAGIFSIFMAITGFRRTLDGLGYLSVVGTVSIFIAGIIGLAGSVAVPTRPGDIQVAVASDFTSAFSEYSQWLHLMFCVNYGMEPLLVTRWLFPPFLFEVVHVCDRGISIW